MSVTDGQTVLSFGARSARSIMMSKPRRHKDHGRYVLFDAIYYLTIN